MIKSHDEGVIKDLLQEALKKLESTSTLDSKLISDMNNNLSWILALTIAFTAFYNKQSDINRYTCVYIIIIGRQLILIMLTVILIFHKLILIRYERNKISYLELLRTHYIELKFDLSKLIDSPLLKDGIDIAKFINFFSDGCFLPSYDIERNKCISKYQTRSEKQGNLLKFTYYLAIVLFGIYVVGVVVLMAIKTLHN